MSGKVRIISGNWRGRKLVVPELPGLRPSGDRVREVLFNWLQGWIAGRRCLDLFAGTGALGLEAASRGAERVTLVDSNAMLCASLRAIQHQWPGGDGLEIIRQDALSFLGRNNPSTGFDLVFLDPPFEAGLYTRCLNLLMRGNWLTETARIYVEHAVNDPFAPDWRWQALREKRVGDVEMKLLCPV